MAKKYIIVGGGAAGIAAAYKILESSRTATVHLFEAAGIYGGRARTDTNSIKGLAFDKGCAYIQDPASPKNPWPRIAAQLGFTLVEDRTSLNDMIRIDKGKGAGFETIATSGLKKIDRVVTELEADYLTNRNSRNATICSRPAVLTQYEVFGLAMSPYGPFTEATEPWNYLAADRAREVVIDIPCDPEDGQAGDRKNNCNLFVKEGLGTLVQTYGEGLIKKYGTRFRQTFRPIRAVSYGDDALSVTDSSGIVYTADACIVTVPVSVLAAGRIAFRPALPKKHRRALGALKMGSYKKLAVQLTSTPAGILNDTSYYLYNDSPQGVWQFFRLSYYPRNVFVVHASGQFAATLDTMPDMDVFAAFRACFRNAYGDQSAFLSRLGITQWSKNANILGAYSYTAPLGLGIDTDLALDARLEMKKPVGSRLFFAGEAYNTEAYGTLHGAYIDGQEAAEDALRSIEGN